MVKANATYPKLESPRRAQDRIADLDRAIEHLSRTPADPDPLAMPFNIDSDREITALPEYKPSTDIAFMSELMNKKELTREERLQLFTAQSLDRIIFNQDNIAVIAMRAHNDIKDQRIFTKKLEDDMHGQGRDLQKQIDELKPTEEDTKVKKFLRENLGVAAILKYLIVSAVSILLARYLGGGK